MKDKTRLESLGSPCCGAEAFRLHFQRETWWIHILGHGGSRVAHWLRMSEGKASETQLLKQSFWLSNLRCHVRKETKPPAFRTNFHVCYTYTLGSLKVYLSRWRQSPALTSSPARISKCSRLLQEGTVNSFQEDQPSHHPLMRRLQTSQWHKYVFLLSSSEKIT